VATRDKPVTTARYPQTPLRIGASPDGVRDVGVTGGETPVATVPGRLHLEQDSPPEYWPDATAIGSTLVWEEWFWLSLPSGQSFTNVSDVADADPTQPA